MKLAIAQMKTSAGDFAQTARRMVDHARRAVEQGVDLLVFPMAVLCGASPVQPVDREGFMLDLADCVMGLAERLACPCLVPILTEFGDVAVPDALLINNGDITPVGLSARLAGSTGESDEQAAPSLPEIEFAGARLGVAFTYEDLDTYDDYAYDVDVIVFLSDYGFAVDDPSSALGSSLTEGRFLADARTTGAWIVGVGSLGCYDLQVFGGSSFVLAPWGELAAQAPSLEEALVVCDVDPSAEGPLAESLTPEVYDAPLMTWGVLAMGLAEICERAGASGACVLLDGTLPSALAAALAVDALGPERVWALVGARDGEGESVARALVRALAVPADHVRPAEIAGEASGVLASGLLQAGLAALAQECGGLVVGAADKTGRALEAAPVLSAAQINPFGDLYRSDLVSLGHLRNTISPVIPPEAFASVHVPHVDGLDEAFPSPEARLGFVDLVLSSYVEWELPLSDIVAERGHEDVVCAILKSFHRRGDVPAPLGAPSLLLSSRTLGEARAPFGLAWLDSVRPEGARLSGRLASIAREEAEHAAADAAPIEREDHEREVKDLLGYLRDFSFGGGFSPLVSPPGHMDAKGPSSDGPSTSLWQGPFSEN